MVTTSTLKEKLCGSEYDAALARIYKPEDIAAQKLRYIRVAEAFDGLFGSGRQVGVFSAPGRTEVGGNHTDHNHGKVLAAGVNLDAVAVASKNDEGIVRVKSEGYDMDVVDLGDLGVMPRERADPSRLSGEFAPLSKKQRLSGRRLRRGYRFGRPLRLRVSRPRRRLKCCSARCSIISITTAKSAPLR